MRSMVLAKDFMTKYREPTLIKAMADMNKGVKIKSKDVFVSGEAMYVRLLTINSKKKVALGRVMSFENSAKPIQ